MIMTEVVPFRYSSTYYCIPCSYASSKLDIGVRVCLSPKADESMQCTSQYTADTSSNCREQSCYVRMSVRHIALLKDHRLDKQPREVGLSEADNQ